MNPIDKALFHILQRCGLIAILRGVQPHEVVAIGHALYDAGFRIIEVPLNSPEPLASIRALRDALPADCLVGAGTVAFTASQAGDENHHAASDVIQTLTVGKATQTITFGALASRTYGDAAFALGATASSGRKRSAIDPAT